MSLPAYTLAPEPQQKMRSRRSFWIMVAVAVVILAGLVGIGVYADLKILKENGTIPERYYVSILERDYATAYSFLDSQATIGGQPVGDQQAFIRMATAEDALDGTVRGVGDPSTSADQTRVTINVHRASRTYDVHLVLKLESSGWKIISADGI
jgi:hypothetical protein